MSITEVQRETLKAVVHHFLRTGEPALRIQLIKQFKNPDLIDDLIPVALRSPTGANVFPTILAFECSGDAHALSVAKQSVEAVIRVLKHLFHDDTETEKMEFTIAEFDTHARALVPTFDEQQIKLGLYLTQDLTGIHAGIGGVWPDLTFVKINERIGLLEDISGVWDEHVNKYDLYVYGDTRRGPKVGESALKEPGSAHPQPNEIQWDFFISHASEDKREIARPLADALIAKGLRIWYDDFSLAVGDSLRASIDRGLARSNFGIVILSHHFFAKHWPQQELNGLVTREVEGRKVILPIWHRIGATEVGRYSPILADKLAVSTEKGLEHVVERLLASAALQPETAPIVKTKGHNADDQKGVELPQTGASLARRPRRIPKQIKPKPSEQKANTSQNTLPDNFLLGARNEWTYLLEESWPDVGCDILKMAKQKATTIEEIGTLFVILKEKQHNFGLAAPFFRDSWETATPADVQRNRFQLGTWEADVVRLQTERNEYKRLCEEAEHALKIASALDIPAIQEEAKRREQRLTELETGLQGLDNQRASLDSKVRDQEAYVFRSQFIDFLHSGRLPINPRNLSNAVAGLPRMDWQQSVERTSAMPFNAQSLTYSVFELISEMWNGSPTDFQMAPVEFFKNKALSLSTNWGYARQFVWDNWRDLRIAIEESWKSTCSKTCVPYVLTSTFIRNTKQQKDSAERILTAREKLGSPESDKLTQSAMVKS